MGDQVEYNWTLESADQYQLRADERPSRVALTAIGLVLTDQPDGSRSLVVHNPHPESWNQWLFPYESCQLDGREAELQGTTLTELAHDVLAIRADNAAAYRTQAVGGLAAQLGTFDPVSDSPVHQTFALRYSITAEVWTVYLFDHWVFLRDEIPELAGERLELDISDPQLRSSLSVKGAGLNGAKISQGVQQILASDGVVESLLSAS